MRLCYRAKMLHAHQSPKVLTRRHQAYIRVRRLGGIHNLVCSLASTCRMRAKLKLDHQAPIALPRTLRARWALWVLMEDRLLTSIKWLHEICLLETRRRILPSFSYTGPIDITQIIVGHCSTLARVRFGIALFLMRIGGSTARAWHCPPRHNA